MTTEATCIGAKSDRNLALLNVLILLWPVTPTTQLSLPTASFIPHTLHPDPPPSANQSFADLFINYPPSPYIYHIPDSSQRSVTFSAYRYRLNAAGTDIVLERAATDARAHTSNLAMGEATRRYMEAISSDQVEVILDRKCLTPLYIRTCARARELVVRCIRANCFGG
ncbi:hypothetical protein N7G274_007061 [Stereocaulon virgatum]|uniref:Uncharacterized protein n=1 Tax=Stereocaulon virgatum TaxID=373712 RepID=A0ABR4A519_9LECA